MFSHVASDGYFRQISVKRDHVLLSGYLLLLMTFFAVCGFLLLMFQMCSCRLPVLQTIIITLRAKLKVITFTQVTPNFYSTQIPQFHSTRIV